MPNAITPSDSEPDEAFGRFAPLQHEQLQPGSHGQDADVDMNDMMMDSVEDESGSSNAVANLEPGSFHPDSVGTSITGRMPTPILPCFAAQVRGNNWGGAAGNVMQSGNTADHQPQYVNHADGGFTSSPRGMSMVTTPIHDRTVPRSLEHSSAIMADWSMVQNRPLPSPISEIGGEEIGSPDMVLDGAPSSGIHMHPLPPQRAVSAMELPMYLRSSSPPPGVPDDAMGTRALPSSPPQEHPNLHQYAQHSPQQRQGSPGAESTSPSPKKGHTRSRHTVNNWTQNLGMKKSFSIGYRADCEKCRLKVPGHFNHIIVS